MHRLSRTILLSLVLLLVTAGLIMLYSTTYAARGTGQLFLQLKWVVAAAVAVIFLRKLDYHFLCKYAWLLLLLAWLPLVYLAGVHVASKFSFIPKSLFLFTDEVKGAYRWLKFGPIRIQPSEFVKICLILFLAYYFGRNSRYLPATELKSGISKWDLPARIKQNVMDSMRGSLVPLLIGAVAALSVLMGGSLSVATITTGVVLVIAFVAGVPLRWLSPALIGILMMVVLIPPLVFKSSLPSHRSEESVRQPQITAKTTAHSAAVPLVAGENSDTASRLIRGVLGEARAKRIFCWLDPEEQAKTVVLDSGKKTGGGGYQLWMSVLALGSGGWTGLGFTESRLKMFYLPEAHTDFIVAVIGEELGFLTVLALILLYVLLVGTCFWMAVLAADKEGSLICVGLGASFGLHAFFNIAVVSGFMPTTGITAPFVSYGGSNVLASGIGIGLLLSVSRYAERREQNKGFEPDLPEKAEEKRSHIPLANQA